MSPASLHSVATCGAAAPRRRRVGWLVVSPTGVAASPRPSTSRPTSACAWRGFQARDFEIIDSLGSTGFATITQNDGDKDPRNPLAAPPAPREGSVVVRSFSAVLRDRSSQSGTRCLLRAFPAGPPGGESDVLAANE